MPTSICAAQMIRLMEFRAPTGILAAVCPHSVYSRQFYNPRLADSVGRETEQQRVAQ